MSKQDVGLLLAGVGTAASLAFTAYYISKGGGGGGGGGGMGYAVSVSVVSASGSNPISGATVKLAGQTQVTNFAGEATFASVIPGSYTMVVSAQNYGNASELVTVSATMTQFLATLTCTLSCASCPCSSCFSAALCECSPLIPSTILVNSIEQLQLAWQVHVGCAENAISWWILIGANGQPLPSCPGQDEPYARNWWKVVPQGTVTDSAGHPVCNTQVLVSGIPSKSQPFDVGSLQGYFTYSYPSSVTTDGNGVFQVPITVTLVITGQSDGLPCITPSTPNGGGTVNLQLAAQYRVSGTVAQATTLITIAALICGDFFPF
jgi:Carboxypeptidase regulatory-like domain